MAFYQRIRDLREDADKTQTEIAAYLGTTAQYYGKYEKGERELPFSRAAGEFLRCQSGLSRRTHQSPEKSSRDHHCRRCPAGAAKIHRPHRTQQGQAGAVSRHPLRTTGSAKRNTIVRVK